MTMMRRLTVLAIVLAAGAASADTGRRSSPFNPKSVGLQRSLPVKAPGLYGVAVSPDGRTVAVACAGGSVRIIEAGRWQEARSLDKFGDFQWAVAFSPDGKTLAMGGADGVVRLFDTQTWKETRALAGHNGIVYGLAWSPDGKLLASGAADNTARLWEASTGKEVRALGGHGNYVSGVAWSADGRRLATSSYDGTVRIWDATEGREERSITGSEGVALLGIAYARNGRYLAVGGQDGSVRVIEVAGGTEVWSVHGAESSIYSVAFTPDSRHVLCAGGRTVRILEAATGTSVAELKHHTAEIYGLALAPGARWFATVAGDFQLKVWGPRPGGMAAVRAKGFFGVSVQTTGDGVQVSQVIKDTAAERVGMQDGDIIIAVGGTPVATMEEAIGVIGSFFVDDEVEFTIKRAGSEMKLKAKLGPRPDGQ